MRQSIPPTPVGRSHGLLSSGIDLLAKNVSKRLDEIFCMQSFLIRLAIILHKSVSVLQNCLVVKLVSNHLRPFLEAFLMAPILLFLTLPVLVPDEEKIKLNRQTLFIFGGYLST